MLIPPHNWSLVERGLSRSGLPSRLNLDFLAKQKIRTIVYLLSAEDEEEEGGRLEPALLSFLSEQHIELIQLGGSGVRESEGPDSGTKDSSSGAGSGSGGGGGGGSNKVSSSHGHLSGWKPTSEELVLSALGHVLDPRLYPLHLMCSSSGRHLTGVVVGCFRKLQRWSLSSIFAEYRRYAGGAASTRGAFVGAGGADGAAAADQLVRNEQFIELFDQELLQATIGQRQLAKHMKQLNIAVAPGAAAAAAAAQAASGKEAAEAKERKQLSVARASTPSSSSSVVAAATPVSATSSASTSAASTPVPSPAPRLPPSAAPPIVSIGAPPAATPSHAAVSTPLAAGSVPATAASMAQPPLQQPQLTSSTAGSTASAIPAALFPTPAAPAAGASASSAHSVATTNASVAPPPAPPSRP